MRRHPTALRTAIAVAATLANGALSSAETFVVTNVDDAGAGSLREAMTQSNATMGEDTIVFSLPANSVIVTAAALPDVVGPVVIDGSGVPGLRIQGFDGTAVVVNALADLTLRDVGLFDGDLEMTGGTLTLEASGDFAIEDDIVGMPLGFRKTGAGTVTLSGNVVQPLFAGPIRVEAGTLAVEGIVTPPLTVGPAGTLAGATGTVASNVTVEGRVAPSTSSGDLTITSGSFTGASALEVDVAPGDSDLLTVSGAAVVQSGARLEIVPSSAVFTSGTTGPRTVLSAGSLSGTFTFTDFAFLDETVVHGPTSVTVDLQPTGETFTDLATTPNQLSVAQTLDTVVPTPGSDLETVLDALQRATAGELPGAFDAIGGEPLTAFATARQILGERTARALHRRVRDAAWGEFEPAWAARGELPLPVLGAGPALRPLGFRTHALAVAARRRDPLAPEPPPPGPVRAGAWVDAYGVYGELEGGLGEADLDTLLYGATLGIDAWLAERFIVGLAAGYARGDVDPDGRDADLTADVIQGALYAGWAHPRGFVSAYGRYAYAFQDSSRDIVSSGIARSADASFEAQDYGAGAEAGVTLFRAGPVAFQPLAGIDWLRLTEESYRESGAGDLSLDVQPEDLDSTTARFGGRLIARFAMENAGELVPELRAFWQTELGDRDRLLRASLLGADTGGAIRVEGAELPRSALLLGVGWSAQVSPALQVLADYDALLDADRVEHQATLAMRVRF